MTHVRRIVQLAALALFINFTFATPHGQTAPPSLKLFTNQAVFGAGSTLEVTIGVQHTGAPAVVDLLFGAILPDGDTVAFFEGPGLSPAFGRLSQIASIRPTYPAVPINAGLTMTPDFFRYTFTGGEPLGQYQLFFAATPPNALRDGRIDAGDLIALQLAPIRLAPPVSITVDAARSGSAVVSRTGGTVSAVGVDGTQYTLTVPAAALSAPTTITLIPVASMSGLAGSLQAVRAVRAEPDGLTFAVPAKLTIRPPAGGPARFVGMATTNGGSGLQLLAAAATNTGDLVIPNVEHFSIVGVAVPSSAVELGETFDSVSDFVSRVVDAHFSGGPEQALMEQWFDTEIRPLLQGGQTDNTALFKGIAQAFRWESNRTTAGNPAITYAAPIENRAAESRRLIANGLRAAIARHNGLCSTERSLNRAEEVMRFQSLATSISDAITFAAVVPSFMPTAFHTLDLTGLTRTSVTENLCVRVAIFNTSFPGSGSLTPGVPATLTVNAGFAMKDGSAPLLSPSLQIRVDAIGATPAQRVGQTNSSGNFTTTFTPSTTGMSLSVLAAFIDASNFPVLSEAALTATKNIGGVGGVIVTPPQTTIAPNATRQFTVVVEGTANQAVVWSVTGGGSITQGGLFTSNGSLGTFFVKATSVQDPDAVGVAQVTVQTTSATELFVTPMDQRIPRGGRRQFFAAITPGGTPIPVTWSVSGGGTIASDGMFTAGDVASNTFFSVKATSIDNPSVTGTARFLVITLRAGRYTSIENTAEVGFFLDAGACGDPANFLSFGKQPRSWTLDVTSLPTAPLPYLVTFTNTDPGGPPIEIDALGNVVGDPLKKITLAVFEGGVNLTYFKVASESPAAPLVAIEPTGLCPLDSLFYPARGWKVFFQE